MKIPTKSNTICGNIPNIIDGIKLSFARIHKIAYITITIPKSIITLFKVFLKSIGIPLGIGNLTHPIIL
jgi:hypothetical protein